MISCKSDDDHEFIWLGPVCEGYTSEGRTWAPQNVWDKCEECGSPAVKYIRADLHEARVKVLEAVSVDRDCLYDALENLLIHMSMGWEIDEMLLRAKQAIDASTRHSSLRPATEVAKP